MNATIKLIPLALVLLGLGIPLGAQEQAPPTASTPTTSAPTTFTNDRLEQMAAPIALYPDALVAQILMASTYPLEIVEASRWVEKNPALTGAALEEALKQNEWDPSVKALCGFPTVLKQMNDNLAWTKDLGDAFLAQKVELMDTIQKMRHKALDAGNLKTTEQQQVVQDNGNVVIEPANPEVIYVPSYSPAVVYGPSWYYPTWYYPGWYDPWPWGFGFVSFGLGFFWGSGCWGSCNWNHHCCNINCNQFNNFNSHTSAHPTHSNFPRTAGSTATWQHDPAHRAGVNYKSPQIAHQFGAAPGSARVMNAQARGVEHTSPMTGIRGNPSGPGARAFSGASQFLNHASVPPMNRSGKTPVTQRSGAGLASGRITSDPSRSFPHGTAPAVSGSNSRYRSAPSYRGSPRSFSAAPPSSRGTRYPSGGLNGYRSPSSGHYSGGWGGASRGSLGSVGGGWHSGGRSGGGFGGGGSHSSGGFGGGGHSSGGFGGGGSHGGGHR
jgi:hypothetical protein